MRPDDLLLALGQLDDGTIQDARRPVRPVHRLRWISAAACICLVLLGLFAPGAKNTPPEPGIPQIPAPVVPTLPAPPEDIPEPPLWSPRYNDEGDCVIADAARPYIPGSFREELSPEELSAAAPPKHPAFGPWEGTAVFDGEGRLLEVVLHAGQDRPVTVTLIPGETAPLRMPLGSAQVSACNGVDFVLTAYGDEEIFRLGAEAQPEGFRLYASMDGPARDMEAAKQDFQTALACFTTYEEGRPDFSAVRAEEIPEWFDRALTQEEALADPDFGRYFLPAAPEGFRAESIRRYKDQNADYLFGLWTKGLRELSWQVEPFREEDKARLAKPEERERYDLGLYPIPRADSVPPELREVVDDPIFALEELTEAMVEARCCTVEDSGDVSGSRFRFTVQWGGCLISVWGKGADPAWVYARLEALRQELSSISAPITTDATNS